MKSDEKVGERFCEFHHQWMLKLEQLLHQLLQASKSVTTQRDPHAFHDLHPLLSSVTSHVKQYYTVKWAQAHQDVLPFFSPTWLSPLENAHSWLTGWKPSALFPLLHTLAAATSSFHLTDDQAATIARLRLKVRMEEDKLDADMERLQVAMADRNVVEIAKIWSREEPSASGGGAVEGVLGGLEKAMKGADCVRLKALKGVMDVLSPLQCVEFLAATIAMQIRLRQCGNKHNYTNMAAGTLKLNQHK